MAKQITQRYKREKIKLINSKKNKNYREKCVAALKLDHLPVQILILITSPLVSTLSSIQSHLVIRIKSQTAPNRRLTSLFTISFPWLAKEEPYIIAALAIGSAKRLFIPPPPCMSFEGPPILYPEV